MAVPDYEFVISRLSMKFRYVYKLNFLDISAMCIAQEVYPLHWCNWAMEKEKSKARESDG